MRKRAYLAYCILILLLACIWLWRFGPIVDSGSTISDHVTVGQWREASGEFGWRIYASGDQLVVDDEEGAGPTVAEVIDASTIRFKFQYDFEDDLFNAVHAQQFAGTELEVVADKEAIARSYDVQGRRVGQELRLLRMPQE